jgi:hypothetical protein
MKIRQLDESFHLVADNGTSMCVVYFSIDAGQANASKRLMKEDARSLAQKIARFLSQGDSIEVPEIDPARIGIK